MSRTPTPTRTSSSSSATPQIPHPASRRVRLTDAWASASYHLDEDDAPDAFVISFADIAIEK
ncbi:hypothetical protein ACIBK8_08120 [Streptomyces sp. NPDC050161]|uniref:hypothetical protein n=1 Tax=Streptomyces sp. NPDC050161 TaxID=3365604 RepID=UPI003794C703